MIEAFRRTPYDREILRIGLPALGVVGAFNFLAGSTLVAGVATIGLLLAVLPLGWGLVGAWAAIIVLMLVRATTLWWWYAKRFAMNGPDPSPSSPAA
jgi:hypothetical protein